MQHALSRAARRTRGFSLVELAIGLVIVATLLSALLVPLATQQAQRRVSETRRLLESAREALLTFAATNRRLPCPADGASRGVEVFNDLATDSPQTGNCRYQAGFLPAATLGLSPLDPQGYLSDPFGEDRGPAQGNTNRIRYAVRSSPDGSFTIEGAATVANPFTATDRLAQVASAFTMRVIAEGALPPAGDGVPNYFSVCAFKRAALADTSCTGTKAGVANYPLANRNAIAVLFSIGDNGPADPSTWGDDERENNNDHLAAAPDGFFVSRAPGTVTGDVFDDQIIWISPVTLMSRLMAAGALP